MLQQTRHDMVQYLRPNGWLTDEGKKVWGGLSREQKLDLYRWMVKVRLFDRRAVILQRQGRIGTYAPLEGQEAAQVGSALALGREDWIFPSYREHGVSMIAGMPLAHILLYWMGRVEGNTAPEGVRVLPPYVPIATQMPQAMGAAWASKLKRESSLAIAYFGDGATSEGDFHEACNFAGVFQLPVLFFCQNNQYAISVPFSRQSATSTVAEKGQAYGIPSVRVDGNDVLAVYHVTAEAAERARNGGGATLIEAVTYRQGSHTTADDATRYRDPEEVRIWVEERDPVDRCRRLLEREGLLSEEYIASWEECCKKEIQEAVDAAERAKAPPPTHLFNHVFETLPPSLLRQREELVRKEGGPDGSENPDPRHP
ncbi:pyruvate dehydrogenase (acetyl-transferring) E1 component subunit alpha [Marinithermofilum abyssi]|uniref:Pyruvate dehydrogenase E1 component subunit alpha n=1 Tax=Marinithermofilum abyssi TaxID=1571185 RepID=A0A8J2VGB3_9BACL|nr:pyruvate dehydrogenase (acetyl-transferring) E1 component subunit alpha [Marinithermofilum abyssi]GGE08175.1 pyruvate dehydrogenase (acetyl-transferring) E1 component subunit alpha [Marinithermofilum abyssi]